MAAKADDLVSSLTTDCAELRGILEKATRPNVQKELQRVLTKLEAELSQAQKAFAKTADTVVPAAPVTTPTSQPVVIKPSGRWVEITTFALDLGGNSNSTVTVDIRLKGVETLPAENVTCDFTEASFDLKVMGLDGQDYRFLRTNLEKDIVPAESSVKVKKNHVIVELKKVKGEYGYDFWSDLCAKGKRKPSAAKKDANPQDSIMSLMKDLYEDGDDNMRKIIGEAMTKARTGEKTDFKDSKLPDLGDMDM